MKCFKPHFQTTIKASNLCVGKQYSLSIDLTQWGKMRWSLIWQPIGKICSEMINKGQLTKLFAMAMCIYLT